MVFFSRNKRKETQLIACQNDATVIKYKKIGIGKSQVNSIQQQSHMPRKSTLKMSFPEHGPPFFTGSRR